VRYPDGSCFVEYALVHAELEPNQPDLTESAFHDPLLTAFFANKTMVWEVD
jgi:hypothetical protein